MTRFIYDGHEYHFSPGRGGRRLLHNNYNHVVGVVFPSGYSHARPCDGPINNSGRYTHTYREALDAALDHFDLMEIFNNAA